MASDDSAAPKLDKFIYDDRIVRAFLLITIVWGLVAFLVGIIVALQLAFPIFNLGLPFTSFGRLRLMRTWGGVMDMSMDGSPIITKTDIQGFYINGGWCYGGFKATPGSGWVYAHTIANDEPHELNAMFSLKRFETGHLIDEAGAGANAKAH